MRKYGTVLVSLFLLLCSMTVQATICPDPNTTSLQWGEPPAPWAENPFSPNKPQGEEGTKFMRANILVATYGRGVTCTYKNSVGEYSIWWQVLTKIPARTDNNWIDTLGGFVCTQGLAECQFYVAASKD